MKKKNFILSCGIAFLAFTACSEDTPELIPSEEEQISSPADVENGDIENIDDEETPSPGTTIDISEAESVVIDRQNEIAAAMLRDLIMTESGNFVISPLTFNIAMGMFATGAEGNTLQMMENAYGGSVKDLNGTNHLLLTAMPQSDTNASFSISSSLWHDRSLTPNAGYLSSLAEYYSNPKVGTLSLDNINNWVSQTTGGNIRQFLSSLPSTPIMAINALDFSGRWSQFGFDKENTSNQLFHNADGTDSSVKMMYNMDEVGKTLFNIKEGYKLLHIPVSKDYSMLFLLPDEGKSVADVAATISGEGLRTLRGYNKGTKVELRLPKFDIEYNWQMKSSTASAAGLNSLFSSWDNDFRGISSSLDKVKLQSLSTTKMRIDEDGVYGSSACTAYLTFISNIIPTPEKLTLSFDRPFIFFLRNDVTNAVIFTGVIKNLSK